VKKQLHENTKQQLAQAISLLRKKQENVKKLRLKKKTYQEKKEHYARSGVEAPTLMLFDSYIRKMEKEVIQAEARVTDARKQVDNLKAALIKIRQECDMLESLEQKEFAVYKKQAARYEQKLTDEVAARTY
jgi:flagellar export protein FliJ